ncbi:MAG: hypothetical protein ACXAC5_01955 [Promethearchaeota archaeon]|jgi:hypothetical protein
MVKIVIKLALWFIIGAAGIGTLVGTQDIQTPWQYTVNSTVGAGSAITVSQLAAEQAMEKIAERTPEGVGNGGALAAQYGRNPALTELVHAETPLPLSAQKTVDLGGPAALICVYLFGSIITYMLKGRRRAFAGSMDG